MWGNGPWYIWCLRLQGKADLGNDNFSWARYIYNIIIESYYKYGWGSDLYMMSLPSFYQWWHEPAFKTARCSGEVIATYLLVVSTQSTSHIHESDAIIMAMGILLYFLCIRHTHTHIWIYHKRSCRNTTVIDTSGESRQKYDLYHMSAYASRAYNIMYPVQCK